MVATFVLQRKLLSAYSRQLVAGQPVDHAFAAQCGDELDEAAFVGDHLADARRSGPERMGAHDGEQPIG